MSTEAAGVEVYSAGLGEQALTEGVHVLRGEPAHNYDAFDVGLNG